jgi:hypothetical protein
MTLSKRLSVYDLATTEEIFDEHGSLGAAAWCAGRLAPRAVGEASLGAGTLFGFRPFRNRRRPLLSAFLFPGLYRPKIIFR